MGGHPPIRFAAQARRVDIGCEFFGITAPGGLAGATAGGTRIATVVVHTVVPGVGVALAAQPAGGFDFPHQASVVVVGAGPVVGVSAQRGAGRQYRAVVADFAKVEALATRTHFGQHAFGRSGIPPVAGILAAMRWQRLAARGGADRRIRTGGMVTAIINTGVIQRPG